MMMGLQNVAYSINESITHKYDSSSLSVSKGVRQSKEMNAFFHSSMMRKDIIPVQKMIGT